MFFAPHLAQQAEEDAEEAALEATAVTTSAETEPKAASDEATKTTSETSSSSETSPPQSSSSSSSKPTPPPDGVSRVVGAIERIQVELHAGVEPGAKEKVTLPDGRVVEFEVPATAEPGHVIEVEVSRTSFAPEQTVAKTTLKVFFERGIEKMELSTTREMLADRTKAPRPGQALVELQQKEFDTLKVERRLGCRAASQIDGTKDPDLAQLQQKFMRTAQRAYLRALDDRAKPKRSLETRVKMSRDDVLEFFDACNTKMALPEFHSTLVAHAKKHHKLPNEPIVEAQKRMLETLGYDRDFGCECLNALAVDYPNDQTLHNAMRVWAVTASNACKAAMADADPSLAPDSTEMKQMADIQQVAQRELGAMTQTEQAALLQSMQQRVTVFQKLSAPDRMRYVAKLAHKDKLDFVKAQILMMRQVQSQMGAMNLA